MSENIPGIIHVGFQLALFGTRYLLAILVLISHQACLSVVTPLSESIHYFFSQKKT
jgi:hypothetical protein